MIEGPLGRCCEVAFPPPAAAILTPVSGRPPSSDGDEREINAAILFKVYIYVLFYIYTLNVQ